MNLDAFVAAALDEDIGPGDRTTETVIPADATGSAYVLAKSDLVVCGHEVARKILQAAARRYDGEIAYVVEHPDGARVPAGTVVARVQGSLRGIIVGERTALNCLMKMSGIATHVRGWVDAAAGSAVRIVDTRKTTPLWRALEKYAVRCGGGHNHRHALYDGVMVKDNHIWATGSLKEAVRRARSENHHLIRIEVEARTLAEVDEALETDADVILLDNLDDATLQQAIARCREVRPHVVLEASGNITPERIERIKHFGLDVISAGGLIHQARWVDLSMKLDRDPGSS
ncbi:MAG: carboxylating nicotinate-nucleotide diphosphorylase [Alphaproteobacteria bacterium]|nr:carboxylating nicotinate-nucleotide diphosphorylase [Alphaproteobacteria bacterium]